MNVVMPRFKTHFIIGDGKIGMLSGANSDRSIGILYFLELDESNGTNNTFTIDSISVGLDNIEDVYCMRMSFNSTESIDALIETLEEVKEYMNGGQE